MITPNSYKELVDICRFFEVYKNKIRYEPCKPTAMQTLSEIIHEQKRGEKEEVKKKASSTPPNKGSSKKHQAKPKNNLSDKNSTYKELAEVCRTSRFYKIVDGYERLLAIAKLNLSERQFEVFKLIHIDGMTASEVSDILGVELTTIIRTDNRAIKNISSCLVAYKGV